jgi:molecular chaperone DnaK (HSP70)
MILGIDLGTEWCRLATADEQGQLQMISSAQKQVQKTPVAVRHAGEWLWGWSALEMTEPAALDLKCLLACPDLGNLADGPADGPRLLGEFLRGLRLSLLEMFGRHRSNCIVLAVPYSFGLRERQVIRQCLADAGLHVDALINDAEAALLACEVEQYIERHERVKVLVMDVGAENTSLSLLEMGWVGDYLRPELIAFDNQTPGFRSVHQALLGEMGWPSHQAVPPALLTQVLGPLLNQERDCTFELGGREWRVTHDQLRTALNNWNTAVATGLRRLWQSAQVAAGDIKIALATGGGAEIQRAHRPIATFPIVLEPPANASPESLVAWGASRYGLMLSGKLPTCFQGPQIPAIGIALADGSFHPILEADHCDEDSDFRVYAPANNGQNNVCLLPMQGFARRASSNWALLPEPWEIPQVPGMQEVLVTVTRKSTRDDEGHDRQQLHFEVQQGWDKQEKAAEVNWLLPFGSAKPAN